MTKKILIINGPNLNLLGKREESKYGKVTLEEVKKNCESHGKSIGFEIKFGQSNINGQVVSFDFVQAWDTDPKEAVDGNYIRLIVDGVGLNNTLQRSGYPIIEDGAEYQLNGTKITSTKITWYVEDEYAKIDQSIISFSLTKKSSASAPPIDVKALDIIGPGGVGSSEDDKGELPGFNSILTIFSIIFISFCRREV